MKSDLEQRVILITGASGGIGASTARAFAREGARLILHYHRNRSAALRLQQQIQPAASVVVRADLRRPTDVRRLFQTACRAFARVDTLVANAGIWEERPVPIQDMTLAQWQRTLQTDLTSVFLCCREFFGLVKRQRRGNVVLVSSTAGVFGEAGHADYAAAKSALAYGLTRTLKNEISRLAPHTADYCGGRVNCVCPGWTVTPLTAKHLENRALVRRVVATMALPQLARAEDVANLIVYLASDTLARHLTGQTLVLAGGMEGRLLWDPGEIRTEMV